MAPEASTAHSLGSQLAADDTKELALDALGSHRSSCSSRSRSSSGQFGCEDEVQGCAKVDENEMDAGHSCDAAEAVASRLDVATIMPCGPAETEWNGGMTELLAPSSVTPEAAMAAVQNKVALLATAPLVSNVGPIKETACGVTNIATAAELGG